MANDYYNHGGYPATGSAGTSATARAEFDAIMAGFALLPALAGNALKLVRVNAGATALESTGSIDGIIIGGTTPAAGAFTTLTATGNVSLGDAVADTLSVSGVVIKNATGNWVIPAPSAGIAFRVDGFAGSNTLEVRSAAADPAILQLTATAVRNWQLIADNSPDVFALRDATRGADVLTFSNTGNASIPVPASGNTLTLNASTTTNAGLLLSNALNSPIAVVLAGTTKGVRFGHSAGGTSIEGVDNTGVGSYQPLIVGGSTLQFQIANTDAINISANRNVTIAAPSAGNHVINSVAGGRTELVQATASTLNIAEAAGNLRGVLTYTAATGNFDVYNGNNSPLRLGSNNDPTMLTASAAGNWAFKAPSAGVTVDIGQIAGTNALQTAVALSGGQVRWALFNSSNTANSSARLLVQVAGSTAADPFAVFDISATQSWAIGNDNSDSYAFVVAASSVLGTSNKLRIPTTGAISLIAGAYTPTSSQAFTATPTFDAAVSNAFEFSGAMTANVTSTTISNPTAGQTISIRVKQDATGGRTFAGPAGAKITGSVGATASAASILTLTYSAMDARWEGAWTVLPV